MPASRVDSDGFDRAMEEQRTRPSIVERRAQRRGESRLLEAGANLQDRAGILLRHEIARRRIEAIVTKKAR